jgi:phosphate transport system permease protein
MRRLKEILGFVISGGAFAVMGAILLVIVGYIIYRGASAISWEFISQPPKEGMTAGGIFPAIVGTALLAIGAILFSLPLGVLSAVYLTEYSRGTRLKSIIRVGVNSLSGVPSVVFGLFGLAIFVKLFGLGISVLAGALTLGVMVLPTIIQASEEALLTVPKSFREASLSLGATRWQTTWKVVLPTALPNILTGVILAIGRAAGETAPIMFTAAAFYLLGLPNSPLDKVMALPYHIYALMTEGTHPQEQTAIAYGTALVLLALVALINAVAVSLRIRARKAKKW